MTDIAFQTVRGSIIVPQTDILIMLHCAVFI